MVVNTHHPPPSRSRETRLEIRKRINAHKLETVSILPYLHQHSLKKNKTTKKIDVPTLQHHVQSQQPYGL